ncbi:MFS transporter [Sulfurimonas sp.]
MSLLLSVFYYFYFSIIGVYIIFFPKILEGVGYSASEVGILFAASPLVRFILPFMFMKGLQLNKKLFNVALVLIMLSSLSFFMTIESFYPLLISNIFLGIGLSLTLPYIEVVALHNIGKERYGRVRLFGSIGFVIVALILVKFLDNRDVALSFLSVLSLITVVFAYLIANSSYDEQVELQEDGAEISLLGHWQLWMGLILMQMSFGAFYNFFTIYETNNGVSLDMTIYLWSFGVLAEILMLFYQGKLLKGNLLKILQLTTLITVIRWLLVYAYPQNMPIMFFAQSLHAFSFALFHSSAISYLFQLYKDKALAQQFFSGITYGFGGLSGALISGFIYEYYPKYLFLSSSLMVFIAFVMLWMFEKNLRGVGTTYSQR